MSGIKTIAYWPKGLKTFTHMSKSCDISKQELQTLISKKKGIPDPLTGGVDSHVKIQQNAVVIVKILDLRWLYRLETDLNDFSKIMSGMPNGFKKTKFSALLLEEFWPPAKKQIIRWIFLP